MVRVNSNTNRGRCYVAKHCLRVREIYSICEILINFFTRFVAWFGTGGGFGEGGFCGGNCERVDKSWWWVYVLKFLNIMKYIFEIFICSAPVGGYRVVGLR